MWFEFFRFDLRYQLRQPLLWFTALMMALMAFGATSSDAIQVGGSMFLVTLFIANPILRDTEVGISDMIFATPMRKHDYLLGRFLAGLVACSIMFAIISLGLLLGPYMPWVDSTRVGPIMWQPYAFGFVFFVIPNLLFIGSVLILLAATSRSLMMTYVGILIFFALWAVAGRIMKDITNDWVAVLVDPFGLRAFARATRYFSTAESNSILPFNSIFMLVNRALWSVVALILTGLTFWLFKPQRAGTGRRWFGKTKIVTASETVSTRLQLPSIQASTGSLVSLKQCLAILWFDAQAIFKSVPFIVMVLFAIMNFLVSATSSGRIFGTQIYPVTQLVLQVMADSYNFMLAIIVSFFAGELVFKERQHRIADVTDAMPMPNWAPLVAKCLALVLVVIGFLGAGVLSGVAFQLIKGGASIEWLLYLKGSLITMVPFALTGFFAIGLQVLTNNKFVGYLLMIIFMISQAVMGFLHFQHNLYTILGTPRTPYSDMNGYGHFLKGWAWYVVYWSFFILGFLIFTQAIWIRGLSFDWRTRLRMSVTHLRGGRGLALALCVLGFVLSGSWIFYNTNVLNHYIPGDKGMDRAAAYEKNYSQYYQAPQPHITAINAKVDIFPEQRLVKIQSHYSLFNKTDKPIDTLYIQRDVDVETRWTQFPEHEIKLDDKEAGFQIVKLKQAIAPQEKIELDVEVIAERRGFDNSGEADVINHNGTFFNNFSFFPHFGYIKAKELLNRSERKKRGLGEPQRMSKLEDEAARQFNGLSREADWIDFETTVSTSADQIAVAPGYLQKTWEENGRRYFHYKMDRPMLYFFSYLSARWEVKKSNWHDVPIEIYYDKKHPYNVDRMIEGSQKALTYFTTHFSPYQHKQIRILEFPQYQTFAQSFANTIPFSEGIGFIADLRDKEDIDYVFYVTAHEVAHQWWGHQIAGAATQGETMLIESLSQYSALMVMEQEYGRAKMRRFLQYELDRYLSERGGEVIEEQPLYRVENQQYIHYRKGSLVFYRLREAMGETALNTALKKFLQARAFEQPPYTNSLELLKYIRAEAPTDKQEVITDLFEKIVFYDNRVLEAKAEKRADGQWDVTFKVHVAKFEVDGKGVESKRAFDETVELGIFSKASGPGNLESIAWSDHRILPDGDSTVTVTVKDKPYEVGVDPFNVMIDRVSRDNRKTVSLP